MISSGPYVIRLIPRLLLSSSSKTVSESFRMSSTDSGSIIAWAEVCKSIDVQTRPRIVGGWLFGKSFGSKQSAACSIVGFAGILESDSSFSPRPSTLQTHQPLTIPTFADLPLVLFCMLSQLLMDCDWFHTVQVSSYGTQHFQRHLVFRSRRNRKASDYL